MSRCGGFFNAVNHGGVDEQMLEETFENGEGASF
jgi:hypothetical protein